MSQCMLRQGIWAIAVMWTIAVAGPGIADSGIFVNASGDSSPVCNCTGEEAEFSLCHTRSVHIENKAEGDLGGGFKVSTSARTGFSSSECAQQDVPPGGCIFWRYHYRCEIYRCWLFFTCIDCTFTHTTLEDSTIDCDE